MAVVTGVAALEMRRVLPGGDGPVVTGAADADDLRVVDRIRRRPGDVVVAVLADVRRVQVGQRVFARRADAVVAAGTVVENIVVIEVGR